MGDPTKHLSRHHADWLAETFRRNRERFAGWRMEDTPPAAPAPSDPPPADPPKVDPPPADKQPPWGKPENFDAEKAWELIQNLRTEKGDPAKVSELEQQLADMQAAQQSQMDALAKALGLKQDDTPPDADALAAQVTAEQAKAREAAVQLAVYRNAAANEANADALLDSASFLRSLTDVDPTNADAINAAIKTAVEANPLLKAAPSTPSTPPFPGGPRTPAPTQAGSLGEAIAGRLSRNNR